MIFDFVCVCVCVVKGKFVAGNDKERLETQSS